MALLKIGTRGSKLALTQTVLVVHPSLPVRTVPDLIRLARAKPGGLNYGSGSTGSTNHLAATLFRSMAGLDFVIVPFRTPGDLVTAAIRNDVDAIIQKLTSDDVRRACDLFMPIWQDSYGVDGRVSLEVDPRLAHDTAGTIAQAKELWSLVDRANLMIKIPATPEGIAAFGQLTAEGINVNITLLFSLPQVEAVWDAYIAGLTARHAAGQPLRHVKAVASFFLSRVDSLLDAQLPAELQGKVAVSLSKVAYQRYLARFQIGRASCRERV